MAVAAFRHELAHLLKYSHSDLKKAIQSISKNYLRRMYGFMPTLGKAQTNK
jgi:hypothetical protein